mmetsp:Transcript_17759/g.24821  ORF Transcript_17759/g.24821 Transcript_17759/m.24821 type:complete len:88 (+) Transcript_17759:139-402(+)|eukprot:CAMPEP_0184505086 /NCGR_PEP_ID=MMETSP0113_2-20130426/52752_1 /TAXON_ID=91329 /ORGANISM="Norrisiella sphaerica, Strain BC52" /LENGTH=87 /DNA_ID=CAMNT_0026894757 /DNA_START=137 /DNA_END=400 /DNA_ORIENTATION=-
MKSARELARRLSRPRFRLSTAAIPSSYSREGVEKKMKKFPRPVTTETDNGCGYAKFLAVKNAALKEQNKMPGKAEHAKQFLNFPEKL